MHPGAHMSGEIGGIRDQLSIDTPELVEIQFPIAGIGSRCLALFLDYLIQGAVFFALILVAVSIPSAISRFATVSEKWAIAVLILVPFLVHWGYFSLFEAFWDGQTPGKRITKIRVIQQTGRPIQLFESMGRNLVRLIDALPGFYGVGIVTIFLTKRQQRLGDLVAGTLVIHERKVEAPAGSISGSRILTADFFAQTPRLELKRTSGLPPDQINRLSGTDLGIIETFLGRRLDLPLEASNQLAKRLAVEMARKMGHTLDPSVSYETFLEGVAHDLRSLRRW
jgi:uncharacterized RDD family membrane protein YckC